VKDWRSDSNQELKSSPWGSGGDVGCAICVGGVDGVSNLQRH
jgi:hypothetical protein